jgi:hypothetical protein
MPGAPDLKLAVKRPFKNADGTTYWAPVGDISLWKDERGEWSGKMRSFASGQSFSVFQDLGENRKTKAEKVKPVMDMEVESPF